jgi:hypothetical protein
MPRYPKTKVERLLKLAEYIEECANLLRLQAKAKTVSEREENIVKKMLVLYLRDSVRFVKLELERDETLESSLRATALLMKDVSDYAKDMQESLGLTTER